MGFSPVSNDQTTPEEPAMTSTMAPARGKSYDADRAIAERLHALVTAAAPEIAPRLWYGMPAYAIDGKLVCHFQAAQKFKTRYATLGFGERAQLDDGSMWPVAYALPKLTAADEQRISALVQQAVS
jgi:uncharacterized protein YdhG (YjbR/CyaY superfamily)